MLMYGRREYGDEAAAKSAGKIQTKGKDYEGMLILSMKYCGPNAMQCKMETSF
jgi:hypothetical protein